MTTEWNLTDLSYQTHILQGVSRTFALTIPQLPDKIRQVVENAYLLCRIADTIEDEPTLTALEKNQFSQEFIQVVAGHSCPHSLSKALHPHLSNSTLETEKELIANIPRIIRLTHHFSSRQQAALQRCIHIMSRGMAEFQQHNDLQGLATLADLDRYCYYVAGVVGELLTELFVDYSPQIAQHESQLQSLAPAFGQALQMTNILKDIWEDRQRGACWLPQEIFAPYGFELATLSPEHHDPAFAQGLQDLIGITYFHLDRALQYILLIPCQEIGIRRFCLWALGMAILTLRKIHLHPNFKRGQQVKISRRSVKATVMISNLSASSNRTLKLLFHLLTHSLPRTRILPHPLRN